MEFWMRFDVLEKEKMGGFLYKADPGKPVIS